MSRFGRAPQNEEEFLRFMRRLDDHLAERRMPISWRQLAAIGEICAEVVGVRPVPRHREPVPGVYSGDDLLLRAIRWYNDQYGDRLIVDFGPGRVLIWLRGDLWVIHYPLITGPAVFAAGTDRTMMVVVEEESGRKGIRRLEAENTRKHLRWFDVLDYVENLPAGMRSDLRRHELESVLYIFCRYRPLLHWLQAAQKYPFISGARADFASAVDHLTGPTPHAGMAKWASQMGAEKALKSYIQMAGGTVKKHHRIREHAAQAAKLGLGNVDMDLFDEIECSAAVRYDEPAEVQEASRAFFNSLDVAGEVAQIIRLQFPTRP